MFLLDVIYEPPTNEITNQIANEASYDPTKAIAAVAIAVLLVLLIIVLKRK